MREMPSTDLISGNYDKYTIVFASHFKLAANGEQAGYICRNFHIKPVR
jgi:hypothetical protein